MSASTQRMQLLDRGRDARAHYDSLFAAYSFARFQRLSALRLEFGLVSALKGGGHTSTQQLPAASNSGMRNDLIDLLRSGPLSLPTSSLHPM